MKTSAIIIALALSSFGITTMAAESKVSAQPNTSGSSVTQKVITLTTSVKNDEGEVLLADSIGKTLYVFDVDQGKPTSACIGDCAEVWPPYILTADEAKTLAAPYGSLARANKKLQLTVQGRPVYTYAFDRSAGDDLGDGLGGVWHYIEIK